MRLNKGRLYIISAPSGTGKSTLCRMLLKQVHRLKESVSYTTRQPRAGEINDVHYTFVSVDTFREMLGRNEFLEHAEVHGNYYGTSMSRIEGILSEGCDVLMDIDVQGARQIRGKGINASYIFIVPPTLDILGQRLNKRSTDSSDTIQKRLNKATDEIKDIFSYDYVVMNEDLHKALDDLIAIITSNRLRTEYVDPQWIARTFAVQGT